ncbi:MAG TPA: PEP-CTERM sorting domain-containing protein [Tepidisphaeraceae bacterium]|jgi:hypothetical protein|nr:PEP-CTERM sorting domain-containing protein [Tepidisphaeraceae bacterium]
MSVQVKRASGIIALGVLGVVFSPLGAHAADPTFNPINLGDLVSDEGAEGTNFVITPGNLIPEFASVTTPKISGVELFSNQAVFSFGSTSFLENTPISALHVNGDELQFWQANTSISDSTQFVGATAEEMTQNLEVSGLLHPHADTSLNTLTPQSEGIARSISSELPTFSAPANDAATPNASSVATSISLNSASNSSQLVQLANPVLSRSASPSGISPVPEPTTLTVLGLSAMGILLRRRKTH